MQNTITDTQIDTQDNVLISQSDTGLSSETQRLEAFLAHRSVIATCIPTSKDKDFNNVAKQVASNIEASERPDKSFIERFLRTRNENFYVPFIANDNDCFANLQHVESNAMRCLAAYAKANAQNLLKAYKGHAVTLPIFSIFSFTFKTI